MSVFIPIPPRPTVWASEKECHQWLLNILYDTYDIEVFDEPRLKDIYGNNARADIGVLIDRGNKSFFFVIEIKHQADRSTNAAAALIQAYHYREMCVVDDDRVPEWVNGKSPTFAFAGVFTPTCDMHGGRRDGMGILASNMKVGNILGHPESGNLLFRSGDMRLFSVPVDCTTPISWQTTADAYLFGSERRNGSRRDRQSVAERFFEMQQTFAELF